MSDGLSRCVYNPQMLPGTSKLQSASVDLLHNRSRLFTLISNHRYATLGELETDTFTTSSDSFTVIE